MADEIFLVNSSSFQDVEISSSLRAGLNSIIDLTQASVVTGSFSGKGDSLTSVSASYIVPEANATASFALTASYAMNATPTISASWASSSISSSYSDTASFVHLAQTTSYVITAQTASYVATASFITLAQTASYVITAQSASYVITAQSASYVATASYVNAATHITLAETASYVITAQTASYVVSTLTSSLSISSSYIIPGATFYLVSGSNGVPPAYIEPYDYCTTDSLYRPPFKEGRLVWDHKYIDYAHYMDTSWRIHLGKEVTIGIRNPTAITMSRMSAVYVSGSTGGNYQPDVYLAQADGTNTKANVIGVIRNDIGPGENGFILMNGVMHRTDMTPYGSSVGTLLYLSPTTPGLLTSVKPGQPNEVVQIGYISETGTIGSFICDIKTEPIPANAYAGMTSIPTFIDNTGSFQFFVSSASVNLYKNIDGIGAITQFPLSEVTFSVPTSTSASFIYATTNGTTASYGITSNFNDINGTNKVQVATVYRADKDIHWLASDREGLALANKLEIRLIETEKFAYESGFSLFETGSRQFFITAGQVWFGATQLNTDDFDSRLTESVVSPYHETHFAYHSASVWTIPVITNGTYNNSHYDNGTNLVPLSTGSYVVNYFFRILGDNLIDIDTFYLASNNEYLDIASAQNDTIPNSIPGVLEDVALLVGRMIVQSGSNTSEAVESAFTTNFGQSLVSQHNSLGGLQGGQGGEYYHMTSADHTGTGIGIMVRQSGASIFSAAITGSLRGTSSWATNATTAGTANAISFVPLTASYANTSSWAINAINGGTQLFTGSTYPITSSWAISASWATVQSPTSVPSASWVSASVKITTADTASYILASNISGYIENATQSIYANSASWVSASVYIINSDTASYISSSATFDSGKVYSHTASYSTTAGTANAINFVPSTATSASWVSASATINSASYAKTSSVATSINFVPSTATSASWISASVKITTADTASYISASATFDSGKVYSHTASYSTTAGTANAINFVPSTATSASWVSASVTINSASYAKTSSVATSINFVPSTATSASWASSSISASYILASNIDGTVYNSTQSIYATSASWASSSISTSYISSSATFDSGKVYILTSSFATTASYVQTIFSRGGTIYDPLQIYGTAAYSQSIVIWRAPFACTVTNVWGQRVTGSGAIVNAWRTSGTVSGSIAAININLNTASVWISASSINSASASFSIGDELDIQLVSSSAGPTQISIQCDFIK